MSEEGISKETLEELRGLADRRLRRIAKERGCAVDEVIDTFPIGVPYQDLVPMRGSVYRALGRVVSRKEIDERLSAPFEFARRLEDDR